VPVALRECPLGPPVAEAELEEGIRVAKVGHTTGFTSGAVISLTDTDNLLVRFGSNGVNYLFNSVYEILWPADAPPFAAAGDSGSLVVTEDGLRPIGLLFCSATNADGTRVSYVVPWSRIKTTLRVEWYE
jgi:hypothetical protein